MSDHAKPASAATKELHHRLLKSLPFGDRSDFEDAQKGFIAPLPDEGIIKNSEGRIVWNAKRFTDFIKEGSEAPDTVNPSLWRQCQLVLKGGLFKVTERIYQIRNADLSNMTVIEGDTGVIVVDPLMSTETAAAALHLYFAHRPKKSVVAVIHSHSHVDHYGGVKGVISEDDVKNGKVMVIAPVGFVEEAISENILAGNVMGRRASYMYGNLLPQGPQGQVGAGLGMTTSLGTITLIIPTHTIKETGERMNIDGLEFEFLMAPESEAPAEMHWYIAQLKALTAAENCIHCLHNTYTPRGAKIRDPLRWSKYLDQTLTMWGHKTDLMYGMHHWPVWGNDRVIDLLKKCRDAYRFINDQTLRLANHGLNPAEIAEKIRFPPELQCYWAIREYYGTVSHNVKATYVKYLGWFDANPATLHPLPRVEGARKYVEYMGGAKAVLENARKDFENGEYRWVAQVVNHVVFDDPTNLEARNLQADALEQMGYQAESGPWRNFYLTGAQELRKGTRGLPTPSAARLEDVVKSMDMTYLLDLLGVRLNADKAVGKRVVLNLNLTDTNKTYILNLENCALTHQENKQDSNADITLSLGRETMNNVILKKTTFLEQISEGKVKIDGDLTVLTELFSLFDTFEFWFNIVEPNKSKM